MKQLFGAEFIETYNNTSNVALLDVRTPEEFSSGHIEGAVNIDFQHESFESEIKKLDVTKTYFVYCRSGNRSGQAISVMKSHGIKDIYELRGGLISNGGTVKNI